MQTSTIQRQDPARARAYFEEKLAFTTGPIEVDHLLKSDGNHCHVVDVRAAEDFAKGHVPGAINLPQGSWDNPTGLSKDRTNIVYCYSVVCHLAAKACVKLAAQGYPVMEMDGGFASWKEYELEVEQEPSHRFK